MSPAATQAAKPDIVLLANADGEVREVKSTAETKKAPARRRSAGKASSKDLSAAADELLAAADKTTADAAAPKAKATTKKASSKTASSKTATSKAAKPATAKKASAKKATTKKVAAAKGDDKAATPSDPNAVAAAAAEQAKAAAAEKEAKAKALASIKIGPKGVYTEDSIRVYLQEIGRIRLLRPDEEIELARKIADLLYLEELAAQFESDNGREPDNKEWAALVEMPLIRFRRRLMLGRRAKEKMVQSNLRLVVTIAKYMNRGLSFQDLTRKAASD